MTTTAPCLNMDRLGTKEHFCLSKSQLRISRACASEGLCACSILRLLSVTVNSPLWPMKRTLSGRSAGTEILAILCGIYHGLRCLARNLNNEYSQHRFPSVPASGSLRLFHRQKICQSTCVLCGLVRRDIFLAQTPERHMWSM